MSDLMSDLKLLDIISEDACCARRLSIALQQQEVKGDIWLCPKCGVEWRAELKKTDDEDEMPYRKWSAFCPVIRFRV